jgi:hypothetical protein
MAGDFSNQAVSYLFCNMDNEYWIMMNNWTMYNVLVQHWIEIYWTTNLNVCVYIYIVSYILSYYVYWIIYVLYNG